MLSTDIDAMAAAYQQEGGQPGIAYGIIMNGRLAHASGLGESRIGGSRPSADTVFRIASLTKSFTASAILSLRDSDTLRLDDQLEMYVPELAGAKATADSPPLTIRHLLTMTAGLPTDDPWSDRELGMSEHNFSSMLREGLSFAWAPGTRYEYSNLGYAILGRVVAAASGVPYAKYVAQHLIEPLGLTRTTFDESSLQSDEIAQGYRRVDGRWCEVPEATNGALSAMCGLYSTVHDLAKWVTEYLDAFPPRDGDEDGHPLRRATRREVQQPQCPIPFANQLRQLGEFSTIRTSSYGFGLIVEQYASYGTVICHSGGFPGFGSHMRWSPRAGIGVVALANSTYAGPRKLVTKILDSLLEEQSVDSPSHFTSIAMGMENAPRSRTAWPSTLAARLEVNQLLARWDDTVSQRLFSENVDLDEPIARRRKDIETIQQQIGPLEETEGPLEHNSPAHCAWWMRGPKGRVRLEILLTPERSPRVQVLRLNCVPDLEPQLRSALASIVNIINRKAGADALTDKVLSDQLAEQMFHSLQMAGAVAGRCNLHEVQAGDGITTATARLTGEFDNLSLTVSLDQATLLVKAMAICIEFPRGIMS